MISVFYLHYVPRMNGYMNEIAGFILMFASQSM